MEQVQPIMRVLLVTQIKGLEEELRRRPLPEGIELVRATDEAAITTHIAGVEVILADPQLVAAQLADATSLRWFQSTFAGVDSLFRDSARRDYRLTRLKGLFGPSLAEYTLGHILARERRFIDLARQQQARQWKVTLYRQLPELTLGILGVGDIGRTVAQAAKAFGLTVWGLRSRPDPVPGVDRMFALEALDDFLTGPDYLVNVLPSTPVTVNLLSGDRLQACRSGTVLINIGRGDVIDEASLVRAVERGWIAGAVLDVFPKEPLPENSPLWDLPGVTITPHVASRGFPRGITDIFMDNLARYRSGAPLNYLVDWERGY